MEIVCRSPQVIEDDDLCEAHTMCHNALTRWDFTYKLYSRDHINSIRKLRSQLEECILNGTKFPGRINPSFLAHWTIFRL